MNFLPVSRLVYLLQFFYAVDEVHQLLYIYRFSVHHPVLSVNGYLCASLWHANSLSWRNDHDSHKEHSASIEKKAEVLPVLEHTENKRDKAFLPLILADIVCFSVLGVISKYQVSVAV